MASHCSSPLAERERQWFLRSFLELARIAVLDIGCRFLEEVAVHHTRNVECSFDVYCVPQSDPCRFDWGPSQTGHAHDGCMRAA
eukprot:6491233-Amphidinium_carterae.1